MVRKKLTIGQKILLTLAFLADALDEVRLLGGLVGFTFETVYGWTPPQYKRQNFYAQVRRLIKKGQVSQVGQKGNLVLNLTREGKQEMGLFWRPLWSKDWDGVWTLVFFDIKEISRKTRDYLRRFLKALKFGLYQRSVWVFPGNLVLELRRLMKEERLEKYVLVISADNLGIQDPRGLVEKIWHIAKLNQRYKRVVGEVELCLNLPPEERKVRAREIKSRLISFLSSDPMLPLKLLPKDWAGRKAIDAVLLLEKNGIQT
jgi:DNA-binding transcriptional regulator PaaX